MNITVMKSESEFADIHRNYGGSSFSGALFDRGYADMPSAWSVWAMFSGLLDDVGPDEDTNARVRLGKAMEPVIAGEVAFQKGWDLIEGWRYHAWDAAISVEASIPDDMRIFVHHPDESLMIGCTVDFYIREHEDGPGIIECKNRDYLQWVTSYDDDDASIRDQIQLAHQLACHPEIQWGAIAALVGGNDLKVYVYKRAALADMISDIEAKWRELFLMVKEKNEPVLTGGELPHWLQAHDERLGLSDDPLVIANETIADDMTFDQMAADYLYTAERRKHYDKIERTRKAQIVQHLDEHSRARSNRYQVRASYSNVKGKSLTTADVEKAGGVIEIRKPHIRVTLKFDDDPMTAQAPTEAALKAGMDAQAPLDRK